MRRGVAFYCNVTLSAPEASYYNYVDTYPFLLLIIVVIFVIRIIVWQKVVRYLVIKQMLLVHTTQALPLKISDMFLPSSCILLFSFPLFFSLSFYFLFFLSTLFSFSLFSFIKEQPSQLYIIIGPYLRLLPICQF